MHRPNIYESKLTDRSLLQADFRDPNWKVNFFGTNYNQLLSIKDKYDPFHLFYALTAVGSDYWTYDEGTGRLCKA